MGGDVRVETGGRVEGDAVSFGGRVQVDPGGEVLGNRVALGGAEEAAASAGGVRLDLLAGSLGQGAMAALQNIARRLALVLAFAGTGVLAVGLWPRNVARVARTVSARPFWYGVAGAILSAALGLGAVLLTVTLVGAPIALLIVALLAIAWLLGLVGTCQALGERLPFAKRQGAWAAFLAGATVLAALAMVPWVGQIVLAALGFPAVGAALVTRLGNRREVDE
jgi:hypothetical protein